MDLNYLKKLLKIFENSVAAELRIEEEGIKIKLSKVANTGNMQPSIVQLTTAQPVAQPQAEIQSVAAESAAETVKAEEKKEDETLGGHIIKSPIVGTFYSAPSPDSETYVEVGKHITKGSTLCIVEAMKLMNEIESDISGTVTKILIENSQPVEYGQPMFVIKPD